MWRPCAFSVCHCNIEQFRLITASIWTCWNSKLSPQQSFVLQKLVDSHGKRAQNACSDVQSQAMQDQLGHPRLQSKVLWQCRQKHWKQASLVSSVLTCKCSCCFRRLLNICNWSGFCFIVKIFLNLLKCFTSKFLFCVWNFHSGPVFSFGHSYLILLRVTLTSATGQRRHNTNPSLQDF